LILPLRSAMRRIEESIKAREELTGVGHGQRLLDGAAGTLNGQEPDRPEATTIRPHTAPWLPFEGVAQFLGGATTDNLGLTPVPPTPIRVRGPGAPPRSPLSGLYHTPNGGKGPQALEETSAGEMPGIPDRGVIFSPRFAKISNLRTRPRGTHDRFPDLRLRSLVPRARGSRRHRRGRRRRGRRSGEARSTRDSPARGGASGERVDGRLCDRVVGIAAGAVHVRDRMTNDAGDPRLARRRLHVIVIRVIELAGEEWERVVAACAPARGPGVAIPPECHPAWESFAPPTRKGF
jgi:hypothetical protein